jgi:hypothetical protein
MLSNSSSNLATHYYSSSSNSGSNQIVNGGQHLKELNYITTSAEYMKDRNLFDDRRKSNSRQQKQPMLYNGKNMSLSSVRYEQQQQQHRNNTNNINFSDNKSNDRYKSNLKNIKRHTALSPSQHEDAILSKSKRDVRNGGKVTAMSSVNETKHVNFNKHTSSMAQQQQQQQHKNQYSTDLAPSFSYLRSSSSSSSSSALSLSSSSSSVSKYHHVSSSSGSSSSSYNSYNPNIIVNSNSNNNPYANTVITETVEQPTLMELECIAGYDGGLPQYFFLEAYDSRTRKLRLNITSALNDVPLFRIDLAGIQNLHFLLS